MPRRSDIESILIIGAGPIVIGQACEFDYSGAQACKALREEGYRVVLVNSNPATIMTDPDMADAVYIEPINALTVERIIAKEKPDALLPTMGGQTALNCALELADSGVLETYGVELIAASSCRPPARCLSRNRCWAGRNSRWRWCATPPTTASSSARSRTSTRWACTPATRSPWPPRRRSRTRNTRSCATR